MDAIVIQKEQIPFFGMELFAVDNMVDFARVDIDDFYKIMGMFGFRIGFPIENMQVWFLLLIFFGRINAHDGALLIWNGTFLL